MNIRQVRKKIKSVTNVKKITKAMQLVSAVKMKKAQQTAVEGMPYRLTLENILKRIVPKVNINVSKLLSLEISKENQNELVLFISSNKGLCGAFNINLFRFFIDNVDVKNKDFICIGKKGGLLVSRLGGRVIADFSSHKPLLEVSAISKFILDKYLSLSYRKVSIVYNQFISTLKFDSINEILLPLVTKFTDKAKEEDKLEKEYDYLIEPSESEILEHVLISYFEEKIRSAIISSEAVEHSARMIAMKNATDNANDVIYNLTSLGNKLRQQKITYELLDMVTAKESVESS